MNLRAEPKRPSRRNNMNYCTDLKTAEAGQIVIKNREGIRSIRTIIRTTPTLIIIHEKNGMDMVYEVKYRRSDGNEPAAHGYCPIQWIEPANEESIAQVREEQRKRATRSWFKGQTFTDAELDAIKSTIDAMREAAAKPQKETT